MKLHSMKKPKKTKAQLKEESIPVAMGEQERYPYGLRINFQKEEVENIPALKSVQAGAMVKIEAVGKVTEVAVTDSDREKKRHRVEVQLQQVGVTNNTAETIFEKALED